MPVDDYTAVLLSDIAHRIRIHSIEATQICNSGYISFLVVICFFVVIYLVFNFNLICIRHPSSCSSCAELFSVLFFNAMRYTTTEPKSPANDRFFLSKGHAAPALYASWAEAGLFPVEDLKNLRKIGCPLEGFPTPVILFFKFNRI
jgi:transketolase